MNPVFPTSYGVHFQQTMSGFIYFVSGPRAISYIWYMPGDRNINPIPFVNDN